MLSLTYYAQNYAGIIDWSLTVMAFIHKMNISRMMILVNIRDFIFMNLFAG